MRKGTAVAAAAVIALAGIVWLLLPTGHDVRPASQPTADARGEKAPLPLGVATPPAPGEAVSAGAPRGGAIANPAGANGEKAAGLPARDAARAAAADRGAARARGESGDDAPAGDAPAERKRELWQGTLALGGRLLDPAGKPIAKAKMRLHDANPWPGAPPRPIVETDAEGRFTFVELPSNHYQLFADAGSGEENVAWYLVPGQPPIDFTLKPPEPAKPDPAGILRVPVVGADGTPVPFAMVRAIRSNRLGGYGEMKDGSLPYDPSDAEVSAYLIYEPMTKDRTPLPWGPVTWTPSRGESVITMPRGQTISGRVLGPDDVPVFGAEVTASVLEPAPRRALGPPERHGRATTDREGRFTLIGLGEGPYSLTVVPLPPHLPAAPVETAVGVDSVVLRLERGLEAEITVLDPEGKPLAGAVVSAFSFRPGVNVPSGRGAGTQITDAAGRARLTQLAPNVKYQLSANPSAARNDLAPYAEKEWTAKDTTVRLALAVFVKGVVRRADGAESVSFVWRRLANGTWVPMTRTKKDGTFEMKMFEPGPWTVAGSLTYASPRGAEVTITDPSVPVTLDAPAAAGSPTPPPTPTPTPAK